MKRIALGAALAAAAIAGAAAPALAGPGQCYTAHGRPIGPVYDTDHPNYAWIAHVQRMGGNCTGVVSDLNAPSRRDYHHYYYYYRRPHHQYQYQYRDHFWRYRGY
jgi:hypothetical protein